MPQSLYRTRVALAVAALAVLLVAVLTGRDFVRNIFATCPGTLHEKDVPLSAGPTRTLEPVYLEPVSKVLTAPASPITNGPTFHLFYEQKQARGVYSHTTEYKNARLQWKEPGGDAGCTCGSVPIVLSGEVPSDITLFHVRGTNEYVVKGRPGHVYDDNGIRSMFTIEPGAAQRLQVDRIFTQRHLPLAVVLAAGLALVVALLRSRLAISYALRIHTWTEARLTPGGLIESESGATLGSLEQTRLRQVLPGPVLVAPEALSTSGLYRDVPIVARHHIAEGTHARWAGGTMVRLRDARALALISAACTLLAFGARLIA